MLTAEEVYTLTHPIREILDRFPSSQTVTEAYRNLNILEDVVISYRMGIENESLTVEK